MNNLFKLVIATVAILILSGCDKPTLDTSSDQAMGESVQKIMTDLSKSDQERFEKALAGIYMFSALANPGGDTEDTKEKINAKLNGKTAKEIFQLADELKGELKE